MYLLIYVYMYIRRNVCIHKVLVDLAQLQDQEVGDGTTSVVIIASELLKRGNDLVKTGIHPTIVMAGFRLAMREAVKYIKSNLVVNVDQLGMYIRIFHMNCVYVY